MQSNNTTRLKRASFGLVSILSLAVLGACGGGGGSTGGGGNPGNGDGLDAYRGLNCQAAANGSNDGYVLGVCDVVTQNGAVFTETSKSSFQNVQSVVGSSKAAPTIADLTSGKSLSILLDSSLDKLNPLRTLSFPANHDPCTYYFSFDGSVNSTNKGFTLTAFTTVGTSQQAFLDITSFASVVPGINGPAAGQSAGICGNTTTVASLPPAVQLVDFDFGVYAYNVGIPKGGIIDPSYNAGWYSRVGASIRPIAAPTSNITFNAAASRVFGFYSSTGRFWNVSVTPTSASYATSTGQLQVALPASWGYFNVFANSSTANGGQTLGTLTSRLPAMTLTGTFDGTERKIIGTITGADIDSGKFEGEFNAANTEFAGRITVKVRGVEQRMAGAFALRL
jgi:hypothetical protein